MNIGIVCYASVGGSGVVATELAKALAARGHQIRLVSSEVPFRLGGYQPGVAFQLVQTPAYPLFREPQYLLALTTKLVQVSREFGLDIIHAHYAVPHATAAYLAKQILSTTTDLKVPKVITTLHGTDVTLIGSDSSYAETVAFCIEQSDGVTTVSQSLKDETYRELPVRAELRVIQIFSTATTTAASRMRRCSASGIAAAISAPSSSSISRTFVPSSAPSRSSRFSGRSATRSARSCSWWARVLILVPPADWPENWGSRVSSKRSASKNRSCHSCRWRICACCRRPMKASGWWRLRRWPLRSRWLRRASAAPGIRRARRDRFPASTGRPTEHGRE